MFLLKKTLSGAKTTLLALFIGSSSIITNPSVAIAKEINIPVHRSIKNQPLTKLEVVALVKSKHKGRILSVKKRPTYTHPDCHYVKILELKGEFKFIKVGCKK